MNRITPNIIAIIVLTVAITSCSKRESKITKFPLTSHIESSPDYLAISAEKESLFQAAETLKPEEGLGLEALALAQIKIYNVYAEKIPALIQKEREVSLSLIHSWGEQEVQDVTREVGKIETDTLQELLATAIRANHAANERFVNFQLLAEKLTQMEEQAKVLSEEDNIEKLEGFQEKLNHLGTLIMTDTLHELLTRANRSANRSENERFVNFQLLASDLTQIGEQAKILSEERTFAKLKDFQEKFNRLGTLILEERDWLAAHPPLINEEAVVMVFKQKHQASEHLEDAIRLYDLKYN